MSDRFGPLALRLAGLSARALGWRPAEFWHATPAELAACLAPADAPESLSRDLFDRMMEHDHD